VSTHSHPKVAANVQSVSRTGLSRFNTQPPEGGCSRVKDKALTKSGFNTQPPEGGCL
ncbi:hypothetical protein HMPREF9065_01210, partial [Aggregatibacter sp. oral taxon 458 str. W10330]